MKKLFAWLFKPKKDKWQDEFDKIIRELQYINDSLTEINRRLI